jgi:hypothetical protein
MMDFGSFWSDLAATLIGGIALAFLFFFAKEKWFALPHITGRWYFEQETKSTAYKPYLGMTLRYVAMLWRQGNNVEGTAEKIYENSSTGERSFISADRTRASICGHIEKNYFGKDKLYLHVVEDGHGRESTHFYELTCNVGGIMTGTFTSMVAEQEGIIKWQRALFW